MVWIGYLQWITANGFPPKLDPVLDPLDTIRIMDAIADRSEPDHPCEPQWPAAEFIVGNPPFLGGKRLRSELGDAYVDALFAVYDGRVPREADLCCYWYEKAREAIAAGSARRAGLLATNSIRGGANRKVLERIKASGDLFMAWADRPWILDGAAVRVSMVGFDDGSERGHVLDGAPVQQINPDLSGMVDVTVAQRLPENLGIAFMGDTKGGPFDISAEVAAQMLASPNPDGRSNSDVVRQWANGLDITRRPRELWIVDFGVDMSSAEAALYEAPFEYVRSVVRAQRDASRSIVSRWWQHERPRVEMRKALAPLHRYVATPNLTKHRLFAWLPPSTLPDHQLIAIARDDDYTLGVLHSRVHELWALATGTQLETRPRYTPTTTFETFPFPRPTDEQREAIAIAARRLVELRDGWLNPPGLSDEELARRTLTNLYNERPTWLANVHAELDQAVLGAYGWPPDLADEAILERLLDLNLDREPA